MSTKLKGLVVVNSDLFKTSTAFSEHDVNNVHEEKT